MVDKFSKEIRSRIMSQIRGKDTKQKHMNLLNVLILKLEKVDYID